MAILCVLNTTCPETRHYRSSILTTYQWKILMSFMALWMFSYENKSINSIIAYVPNIKCSLAPSHRGGPKECPHSVFRVKISHFLYTPSNPIYWRCNMWVYWGVQGVGLSLWDLCTYLPSHKTRSSDLLNVAEFKPFNLVDKTMIPARNVH